MEPIRLQKYMSSVGLMSRRKAEEEITAGRITVNGIRAGLGDKILPGIDDVRWNGEPVVADYESKPVVIMLNKPRGVLTAMSDDRGRVCVSDLVTDVGCRVYPCGRLDFDSEGLLLMTNDGELANRLTHPRHHIPKTYHVRLEGQVPPETIKALGKPMVIDDYRIRPVEVDLVALKPGYTVVSMVLHEGRNRQIRKMCAKVGCRVLALKRVAIGDIRLGLLKEGAWKKLTRAQYDYLMNYGTDAERTPAGNKKKKNEK